MIVASVGSEALEDGRLELEGYVVASEMIRIGGREDLGQADEATAFIPARLATVEVGAQGQPVLLVELAHDLEGQETVPAVAAVTGH
jgi:hypothetical protein